MRRLYESDAVERDDEDAFVPGSREDASRSTIDWQNLSHAIVPMAVRTRAVSVAVATSAPTYAPGEPVPFRVTMRNALPIPITIRTVSPIRWSWAVDDLEGASEVDDGDPPDRATLLEFASREAKTFERTWSQQRRVSETEWEAVEPGTHTLSAWVNVEDPAGDGLRGETTFRIE